MGDRIVQLNRDNDEIIVISQSDLAKLVERCVKEQLDALGGGRGACAIGCAGNHGDECSIDTRISFQRKQNLMRQGTDLYVFGTQMPLEPGQTKSWIVPPYRLGRVIENLFFRPQMADGGNVDDIQVEILGEDGVRWAIFSGGRHNHQTGCCLLEFFRNDCIGYDEGFTFRLTHLGAAGAPNMVRATADWNYLFDNSPPRPQFNWSWPKRCSR